MPENVGSIYSDFILDTSKFEAGWSRIKSAVSSLPGMMNDSTNSARKGFDTIDQGATKSAQTLGSLNAKLSELKTKLNDTEIGSKAFKTLQTDIQKAEEQITQANKTGGFMSEMLSGAAGTAGILGAALTGFSGVLVGQELLSGISNIVQMGAEFEQTRVAFETMLGDADVAKKVLTDLSHFADITPFDDKQVVQAGRSLLAFGTSADQLIPQLRVIGDVASGVGKDFNELAIIWGKAQIAGRVMNDDLRQLTEAGIPAIKELAKVLNVSESQVRKLAEDGKISFADLQRAFVNMTSEGGRFAGMMQKQSETLLGLYSTLQSNVQRIFKNFGTESMEPLKEVTRLLIDFTDKLARLAPEITEEFGDLFSTLKDLKENLFGGTIFDNEKLKITSLLIKGIADAITLSFAPIMVTSLGINAMILDLERLKLKSQELINGSLNSVQKKELDDIEKKIAANDAAIRRETDRIAAIFRPRAEGPATQTDNTQMRIADSTTDAAGGRTGRQRSAAEEEKKYYDELRKRYEFEAIQMQEETKLENEKSAAEKRSHDQLIADMIIEMDADNERQQKNEKVLIFYENLKSSLDQIGKSNYSINVDVKGEQASQSFIEKLDELKRQGKIDYTINPVVLGNGEIVSHFKITPKDQKDQETLSELERLTDQNKESVANVKLNIETQQGGMGFLDKIASGGAGAIKSMLDEVLKNVGLSVAGIGQVYSEAMSIWQTQIDQTKEMMRRTNEEQNLFMNVFSMKFSQMKQQEIDDFRNAEDEKINIEKNAADIRLAMLDDEYQKAKAILDQQYQDTLLRDQISYEQKLADLEQQSRDKEQTMVAEDYMEQDNRDTKKRREKEYQDALAKLAKDAENKKAADKKASDDKVTLLEKQKNDRLAAMDKEKTEQEKQQKKAQAFLNWQFQSASLEMTKRIQVVSTTVQTITAAAQVFGMVMGALSMIPIVGPFIALPTAMTMSGMILAQGARAVNMIQSQVVLPPAELFMADGAVATGPTRAVIGEAGKEAVIPLDNPKATQMLFDGLSNAIRGAQADRVPQMQQPRIYQFQFDKDSVHVRDENDVEKISQEIMQRIEARFH